MTSTSFGGSWTEEKLAILRRYLDAYTTALKNWPFTLIYVDAFAGKGMWRPKSGYELDDYGDVQELQKGSPLIALEVQDKPFDRLMFVDKDPSSVNSLWDVQKHFPDREVKVVYGDANVEIPRFCDALEPLDRAIVFLDPYATQVDWQTIEAIANTKQIDCWILFPRMAIARMMPVENEPSPELRLQLDRIFGGRQYWQDIYSQAMQMSLLQEEPKQERLHSSDHIAMSYLNRMKSVFTSTASVRRTFRNSKGSPIFELFFAAGNAKGAPTAVRIAEDILRRW